LQEALDALNIPHGFAHISDELRYAEYFDHFISLDDWLSIS
jgi:hypothetical protein